MRRITGSDCRAGEEIVPVLAFQVDLIRHGRGAAWSGDDVNYLRVRPATVEGIQE